MKKLESLKCELFKNEIVSTNKLKKITGGAMKTTDGNCTYSADILSSTGCDCMDTGGNGDEASIGPRLYGAISSIETRNYQG